MLDFKMIFYVLAIIVLIAGIISICVNEDQETFRYSLICAMLIKIYAEVSD